MSIKRTFGGASLLRPATYSKYKVDNSGGAPLDANNTLFLVGEATMGKPGSVDGVTEFYSSQVQDLVNYYGNGPVVDAALAAISPSKTQGVQGAGKILVYITNALTLASKTIKEATATNDLLVISNSSYGIGGNDVSITIANGTAPATQKLITVNKIGYTSEILPENVAQAQIVVQYTGNATTAVLGITGATKAAKVLTITLAGQSDSTVTLTKSLQNLTMKQLVDQINGTAGYTCTLSDTAKGTITSATDLDMVTGVNAKVAVTMYRLQQEIVDNINTNSKFVTAALATTPRVGLPVNGSNSFLTGGAQGASSNTEFSTGLAKSLAKFYNVVVPCIAQDATADITLGNVGGFVTDGSSSYTIASVIAATSSHVRLRETIKNKKEAQAMVGFRASTKAAVKTQAQTTGSYLVQLAFQDAQVLDVYGNLVWKQPYITAAKFAGIRLGTDIGTPLTYKVLDVNGLGHYVTPSTGVEAGDANTDTDYDELLEAGILYCEKAASGFRTVCDCTTYGADQSFVFNRGSVVAASHYIFQTLRNTCDQVFIGNKVSNGLASSIKSVLEAKLGELNTAEVIIKSDGAPRGYDPKSFVVTVVGNTVYVEVYVYPVSGVDFILISFTLGEIKQSA